MNTPTDYTYKAALRILWTGLKIFMTCWWRTIRTAFVDAGLFLVKHPIAVFLLLSSFIMMFVSMAKARVERDRGEIINYELTLRLDSIMASQPSDYHPQFNPSNNEKKTETRP